jgi:hypothetical protein
MGVSGQLYELVVLTPGEVSLVPRYSEARLASCQSQYIGDEKNHLPLPGIQL